MAGSRKFGDWDSARRTLETLATRTGDAARKAWLQEAHRLRGKMVEGIREQAPGGKRFAPLSPLTLALRELDGFQGTKALIVHGDLRNSIAVIEKPNLAFIGVARTAVAKDGHKLVDVAAIHEFGTKTYTIKVTARMRLAWALYKGGGHAERKEQARDAKRKARGLGEPSLGDVLRAGPGQRKRFEMEAQRQQKRAQRLQALKGIGDLPEFMTIRIPARPFLRPVFDAEQPGMKKRIEERFTKNLGNIIVK